MIWKKIEEEFKGRGKNKLSQDGAEYSAIFEARVAMHIEIFIATRNKEDG